MIFPKVKITDEGVIITRVIRCSFCKAFWLAEYTAEAHKLECHSCGHMNDIPCPPNKDDATT